MRVWGPDYRLASTWGGANATCCSGQGPRGCSLLADSLQGHQEHVLLDESWGRG